MGMTGKPDVSSTVNVVPVECCASACGKASASPNRAEVVSFTRSAVGKEIPRVEPHAAACIAKCFGDIRRSTAPGVCPADGERVVRNSLARLEVAFYEKGVETVRVCLHDGQCLEILRARRCSQIGYTYPVFRRTDEGAAVLARHDRFQTALRNAAEEPYASTFGNGFGCRRSTPMRPR